MTKTFVLLGAAAMALTACGDRNGAGGADNGAATADNMGSDMGNTASAAQGKVEDTAGAAVGMGAAPAANTADGYVTNAAISDMYEIEASKLALQKSQSPAIKKFAQQMIADHTKTSDQLKATLKTANLQLTPPKQLDDRRQGMIDNLKPLSGKDFDKAYLDQQTAAHSEAHTLHSDFAEDGDNDALKKFAATTAPKVQHHLDMVKQLDKGGADGTH